jgi:poly(3-hydroxybutyrate) depolymerase
LRPYLKTHHVQTGVGHYGVFNGHRWERQIYPRVRAVIYDNEPRAVLVSSRARTIQPMSVAAASEVIAAAPAASAVGDVEIDTGVITAAADGVGAAAKPQQESPAPRRRPPATQ